MATPTPEVGTFRVTWLAGRGDHAALTSKDVQADTFGVHETDGFVAFRTDIEKTSVFSIRTEFLVSIERIASSSE
jgi:hypothetical protein